MKKLFFCLLAMALSCTSYALTIKETPVTLINKNDTTFFVHKNIKYLKSTSLYDSGYRALHIQNVDVKYDESNTICSFNID